jgi:hypothetical protein
MEGHAVLVPLLIQVVKKEVIAGHEDDRAQWQANHFLLEAVEKAELEFARAEPGIPVNPVE